MSISTEWKNLGSHRERAKSALDDVVSSTEELVKSLSGELVPSLGDLDDDTLKMARNSFKLADSYKRLLVETVEVNLNMAKQIDELQKSVDKLEEIIRRMN